MTAKKVVIVGAGAAGVFTAYRLREMYGEGAYEVTLLEARDRIGGNCYSKTISAGGSDYSIDCGAQFFFKNPQVSYVELLEKLGLTDDATKIIEAESGFTIWDRQTNKHRLHVPDTFGALLTGFTEWGRLIQLGWFLVESYRLDRSPPTNWDLSVDEWLTEVEVTSSFKEDVIKPFLYQFLSLPKNRIGLASARYATTYFARNVFGEPGVAEPDPDPADLEGEPVFKTYQSLIGLDGIHQIVLDKSGATLHKQCAVTQVVPTANGKLEVSTSTGDVYVADHVVMATDPPTSANILEASHADAQMVSTLRQIEYGDLDIAMQQGTPCYMPTDKKYWEPVNTIVDGDDLMFTAWFGPLRPLQSDGKMIPVFKSWGANLSPKATDCPSTFFVNHHRVIYPTTVTVGARDKLMKDFHGVNNVWFAGGWTNWFDSQEACLDSATKVAAALPGQAAAGSGRVVPYDEELHRKNLERWLRRVKTVAPDEHNEALDKQIRKLDT